MDRLSACCASPWSTWHPVACPTNYLGLLLQLPWLKGKLPSINVAIAVAMAADGRGWPRKLLRLDVRRNCRGNCCGLPWIAMVGTTEFAATGRTTAHAVAIAADFRGNRRVSEDCRGKGRGRPRVVVEIAAVGRPPKLPGQLPRTSVGCHGWYNGVCRRQNCCRGHNRDICRGSAMSRGICRGNPQISTVARGKTHESPRKFHGHCRGPPPKSQIMCIVHRRLRQSRASGVRHV